MGYGESQRQGPIRSLSEGDTGDSGQPPKKEKAVYELFVASRGNARIRELGEEGMERWIGTSYC